MPIDVAISAGLMQPPAIAATALTRGSCAAARMA
jgi:hypothetical protein